MLVLVLRSRPKNHDIACVAQGSIPDVQLGQASPKGRPVLEAALAPDGQLRADFDGQPHP